MAPSILMVCLGNICRSPLAEGILRQKMAVKGISGLVDSAGTGNWHIGEPPHHDSQRIARHHALDISTQRARQLKPDDFDRFDYIFFMDSENMKDGRNIAGKKWQPSKSALLLDVLPHQRGMGVPDPYFGGYDGFEKVYDIIDQACEIIAQKLANFEDPLQ